MRGRRGIVYVVVWLLCSTTAARSQTMSPQQIEASARASRDAGDYVSAIEQLQRLAATGADAPRPALLLAETLAWAKRFPEAEQQYRLVLTQHPDSRDAQLGLARVLMWEGRYGEARAAFNGVLKLAPADLDAIEGLATVAYWTGDLRNAERLFESVVAREPRDFSRRSLGEIRQTARPEQRATVSWTNDDQPYRVLQSQVEATVATDPLTRWRAAAGSYWLNAPLRGRGNAPFLLLSNNTVAPAVKLTFDEEVGAIRFADGTSHAVGHVSIRKRTSTDAGVTLRLARTELLATATSLSSHPFVDSLSLSFARESNDGLSVAAEAATQRYFDRNHGWSAWAYVMHPLIRRDRWRIAAGASANARDTSQTRFGIASVSSLLVPDGGFFTYTYRGEYAPYWTPQNLREGRIIAVVESSIGAARVQLHADGGFARDSAVAFGPSTGLSPLPSSVFEFTFGRTFKPYNLGLNAVVPATAGIQIEVGVSRAATAFYRASSVHAAVVRHY